MSRRSARKHGFNLLFQYSFLPPEEWEEALSLYFQERQNIDAEDKEFICKEVGGASSYFGAIDDVIGRYAKGWAVDRISKVDLSILRLAIYEILYEPEIPKKVAANEAVELAKLYSGDEAPGFINGILGSVLREESK